MLIGRETTRVARIKLLDTAIATLQQQRYSSNTTRLNLITDIIKGGFGQDNLGYI